jgi:Asp-tRNA(Asn)/Glu-tRNA(Gln) amidotransferase C subunit
MPEKDTHRQRIAIAELSKLCRLELEESSQGQLHDDLVEMIAMVDVLSELPEGPGPREGARVGSQRDDQADGAPAMAAEILAAAPRIDDRHFELPRAVPKDGPSPRVASDD